jgi:large subunit ribosomal protein L17
MRHKKHTFKIGKSGAHRKAMMANLLISLFTHGRIKTTTVKAKELRRWTDKMITCAKKGDLHSKRKVVSTLRPRYSKYDRDLNLRIVNEVESGIVDKLFGEIAAKYKDRNGGYTRIIKTDNRKGDGAPLCLIELVEEEINSKTTVAPAKEETPAATTAEVTEEAEVVATEETAEAETAEATPEVEAETAEVEAEEKEETE